MALKHLVMMFGAFIGMGIVGSVGWVALSGVVAGVLDTVGIHLPGPMLVAVSPFVGVVAGLWGANEVSA